MQMRAQAITVREEVASAWLERVAFESGPGGSLSTVTLGDFCGESITQQVCHLSNRADRAECVAAPSGYLQLTIVGCHMDLGVVILGVRPKDADQRLVSPRTVWERAQVASHSIDVSDLGVGQADKTALMDVSQHVARFATELVPAVLAIEAAR